MHYSGLIIAAVTFLIIGVFHPIVIKTEYHFGKGVWWVFLLAGLALLAISLFISQQVLSIIIAVVGITCLWSIKELFEQEQRVQKGWFPANPKRKQR